MLGQGVKTLIIGAVTVRLHAPWVSSLKEKRMVVKSIIAKVHNKFHVAIAEVEEQDTLQTAVLGMACVAGSVRQVDSILDHVIRFIEENTEAEITDIQRELR